MKYIALLVALCLLAAPARALDTGATDDGDDFEGPHVIAHKGLHAGEGGYLVVGRPFTVSYTLFNQGTEQAKEVALFDTWPEEYFTVKSGSSDIRVDLLEAGTSDEYNVTLVPLQAGLFTPERATLSYTDAGSEEEEALSRNGFSSSFGQVQILTDDQYERLTATYSTEWVIFLCLCTGPILLPFVIVETAKQGKNAKRE